MNPLHAGKSEPALLRWLGAGLDAVIVILGAVIVGLVFVNVLARGVLSVDVAFTTELCEFLLLWVTLLGGAAATRRGAHMRVLEILLLMGSGRLRRTVEALVHILIVVVLGLLVWFGVIIVNSNWDNQMTVLYWPIALQYMALPVGSAFTLVYAAYDLIEIIRGTATFDAVEIDLPVD